jgi:O-methyltransferase
MRPTSDLTRTARQLGTGMLWRLGWLLPPLVPPDFEPELADTYRRVRRHTMTGPKRVAALCDAVQHVVRSEVPGAIAECGVWRGGSMMAAAITLQRLGVRDRDLYLFDTFAGMPPPTKEDTWSAYDGYSLEGRWKRGRRGDDSNAWHYVSVEEVRRSLLSTGYPDERIHLVQGLVEDTIPEQAPQHLALLRLDTDWYQPTRHELIHLYPRLVPGGVLIIDDYGHYEGARKAVDEYFDEHGGRPLLARVDYTGRMAVKAG